MDYKTRIEASIQEHLDAYMDIVKTLYDNPETGFEEYETQKVLVKYLKDAGFDVKSSVVVDTDFVAEYKSVKEGPTIAYMCEYDALPEVGHGCGHNLIAGIGIAAGEALKSVIDEIGGIVRVVGTPGEENFGGKVKMSEAGVFDDVDAALMDHWQFYQLSMNSLAKMPMDVILKMVIVHWMQRLVHIYRFLCYVNL